MHGWKPVLLSEACGWKPPCLGAGGASVPQGWQQGGTATCHPFAKPRYPSCHLTVSGRRASTRSPRSALEANGAVIGCGRRDAAQSIRPRSRYSGRGNDAELLHAITGGDRAAVEVYDRHGTRLYGRASQMCRPAHASDIVAAFDELWTRPQRFCSQRESLGLLLNQETHRRAVTYLWRDRRTQSRPLADLILRRAGTELSRGAVLVHAAPARSPLTCKPVRPSR